MVDGDVCVWIEKYVKEAVLTTLMSIFSCKSTEYLFLSEVCISLLGCTANSAIHHVKDCRGGVGRAEEHHVTQMAGVEG